MSAPTPERPEIECREFDADGLPFWPGKRSKFCRNCKREQAEHVAPERPESPSDRDWEWWEALGGVDTVAPTPEACKRWQMSLQELVHEQGRREGQEQAAELREIGRDLLGFFNPKECDCAGRQNPCALCRMRGALAARPEEAPKG